jgi:hypothetical protein
MTGGHSAVVGLSGDDADRANSGAESTGRVVTIGSKVRIRSVWEPGHEFEDVPVSSDASPECIVTLVAAGDAGLYRLTPRTPLARALLGHRAGDVVSVSVEARTVQFEVVGVEGGTSEAAETWCHG